MAPRQGRKQAVRIRLGFCLYGTPRILAWTDVKCLPTDVSIWWPTHRVCLGNNRRHLHDPFGLHADQQKGFFLLGRFPLCWTLDFDWRLSV